MRRLLTASALFALAVCVTGASGQPPAKLDPPPKALGERLDKNPDPTDAAIAAALANDPDVKMRRRGFNWPRRSWRRPVWPRR